MTASRVITKLLRLRFSYRNFLPALLNQGMLPASFYKEAKDGN